MLHPGTTLQRRTWPIRLPVLLAIALVAYAVATHRHWVDRVPLLPTTTIELNNGLEPIAWAGPGELVFAHRGHGSSSTGNGPYFGPLEFRSFPDGGKLRNTLSPGDPIQATFPLVTPRPDIHARIFPGATVLASPAPDSPERLSPFYFIGNQLFVYIADNTLHCCDARRNLWSTPGVQAVCWLSGNHALVSLVSPLPGRARPHAQLSFLTLHDGRLDTRIAPGSAFDIADVTSDGRFIALLVRNSVEVWSLESGIRLWRAPFDELGVRQLRFSQNGEFMEHWTIDESARLRYTKFRTLDGQRIAQPDEPRELAQSHLSAIAFPGHEYAFFHEFTTADARISPVMRLVSLVAGRYFGLFVGSDLRPKRFQLYDLKARQRHGVIDKTDARLITSPEVSGFALVRHRPGGVNVELYELPPRRDWKWLAIRGVAPVLAALVLALLLSRWRTSSTGMRQA